MHQCRRQKRVDALVRATPAAIGGQGDNDEQKPDQRRAGAAGDNEKIAPVAKHRSRYAVSPTSTTCNRRGPCAPSSSDCSISAERDGPVTSMTLRGIAPISARNKSHASS